MSINQGETGLAEVGIAVEAFDGDIALELAAVMIHLPFSQNLLNVKTKQTFDGLPVCSQKMAPGN
jgi:hypothetical protein